MFLGPFLVLVHVFSRELVPFRFLAPSRNVLSSVAFGSQQLYEFGSFWPFPTSANRREIPPFFQ